MLHGAASAEQTRVSGGACVHQCTPMCTRRITHTFSSRSADRTTEEHIRRCGTAAMRTLHRSPARRASSAWVGSARAPDLIATCPACATHRSTAFMLAVASVRDPCACTHSVVLESVQHSASSVSRLVLRCVKCCKIVICTHQQRVHICASVAALERSFSRRSAICRCTCRILSLGLLQ